MVLASLLFVDGHIENIYIEEGKINKLFEFYGKKLQSVSYN